ncbi:VOC family protein [Polaromonas hydrogenivorans]|uniref:VOC family protein n=1 Tax=Polaromonas hydrogenivorans TaxID=335476 RepID=A0AAU7LZW2_9BURK
MLQKFPIYAYIPASDVSRAREFYEGKLGFVAKQETAGGVVYECGAHTACFLYPTPNAGTSQASQAFWTVDDVDREVTELKARGVVFEDYDMLGEKSASGAITAGGAKAAWFKDTEGNIMALVQSL